MKDKSTEPGMQPPGRPWLPAFSFGSDFSIRNGASTREAPRMDAIPPAPPVPAPYRLMVLVVAYQAEATIADVLSRLPRSLPDAQLEVLVLDDASTDATSERALSVRLAVPATVVRNPSNQGYGGNQKIGYRHALMHGFDAVALLHGDGQYAPEALGRLARPLLDGSADVVFGSRMMQRGDALRGGMPLYKFVGNTVLSFLQNRLCRTRLSEFHCGYRLYSTAALRRAAFARNSDGFAFDTEIILQMLSAGQRIVELPIPTHYGDEVCRVNGVPYAWRVLVATVRWRLHRAGLLHDPRHAPDSERPATAGALPGLLRRLRRTAAGPDVLSLRPLSTRP